MFSMQSSSSAPRVTIQCSDMPEEMLEAAIETAYDALKKHNSDVDVAQYIKTRLDQRFDPVWMAVVGRSFGVYVSHQSNYFAHFYLGHKAIVVFKGL